MHSHDMKDIIAVLDKRLAIVEDVIGANEDVRAYLADPFSALLGDDNFIEALSGHLPRDTASQQKLPMLIERMEKVAQR